MLTTRRFLFSATRHANCSSVVKGAEVLSSYRHALSSLTKVRLPDENGITPSSDAMTVADKREAMKKISPSLVYGQDLNDLPAPILPEHPEEISTLDPVDLGHRTHLDGSERTVIIRQRIKKTKQSPLNQESIWQIFFNEDGMSAESWESPLMGWISNADPYQADPELTFRNAMEAVYFAKKRGWKYYVYEPIRRKIPSGHAYQDNFLPKAIVQRVIKEGTHCDEWHRTASGASHYHRPLKYHGDGIVQQHGPNPDTPTAPHVEGVYKIR